MVVARIMVLFAPCRIFNSKFYKTFTQHPNYTSVPSHHPILRFVVLFCGGVGKIGAVEIGPYNVGIGRISRLYKLDIVEMGLYQILQIKEHYS